MLDAAQLVEVVNLLGLLLVIAVALGLIEVPCSDPACRVAHGDHRRRTARAAAEAFHRSSHSPDYPSPGCEWCRRPPDPDP